jgi:WD40 repeat protein
MRSIKEFILSSKLPGHQDYVYDLKFLANNNLVSSSKDKMIRVWERFEFENRAKWSFIASCSKRRLFSFIVNEQNDQNLALTYFMIIQLYFRYNFVFQFTHVWFFDWSHMRSQCEKLWEFLVIFLRKTLRQRSQLYRNELKIYFAAI